MIHDIMIYRVWFVMMYIEYILAGPGHYNLAKCASIRPGESEILSSTNSLKPKPIDSFQIYKEAMQPSKYAFKKSTIAL